MIQMDRNRHKHLTLVLALLIGVVAPRAAPAQPAQTMPAPSAQTAPVSSVDLGGPDELEPRGALERRKLEAEIKKLEAETLKLRAEQSKLTTDEWYSWIAPTTGSLSVLFVIVSLVVQRSITMRTQREQLRNATDLKAAEIIFGSLYPDMAMARAALLQDLVPGGGISRKVLESLQKAAEKAPPVWSAVGALNFGIREAVFKEIAAKYADQPEMVLELAQAVFSGDAWLKRLQLPGKKGSTPQARSVPYNPGPPYNPRSNVGSPYNPATNLGFPDNPESNEGP